MHEIKLRETFLSTFSISAIKSNIVTHMRHSLQNTLHKMKSFIWIHTSESRGLQVHILSKLCQTLLDLHIYIHMFWLFCMYIIKIFLMKILMHLLYNSLKILDNCKSRLFCKVKWNTANKYNFINFIHELYVIKVLIESL